MSGAAGVFAHPDQRQRGGGRRLCGRGARRRLRLALGSVAWWRTCGGRGDQRARTSSSLRTSPPTTPSQRRAGRAHRNAAGRGPGARGRARTVAVPTGHGDHTLKPRRRPSSSIAARGRARRRCRARLAPRIAALGDRLAAHRIDAPVRPADRRRVCACRVVRPNVTFRRGGEAGRDSSSSAGPASCARLGAGRRQQPGGPDPANRGELLTLAAGRRRRPGRAPGGRGGGRAAGGGRARRSSSAIVGAVGTAPAMLTCDTRTPGRCTVRRPGRASWPARPPEPILWIDGAGPHVRGDRAAPPLGSARPAVERPAAQPSSPASQQCGWRSPAAELTGVDQVDPEPRARRSPPRCPPPARDRRRHGLCSPASLIVQRARAAAASGASPRDHGPQSSSAGRNDVAATRPAG